MYLILLMRSRRNEIFHSLSWKLVFWKKECFLNVGTHFSIYRMSNKYLFSFFLPQGCWMIIHREGVLWSFKMFRDKYTFNHWAVWLDIAGKKCIHRRYAFKYLLRVRKDRLMVILLLNNILRGSSPCHRIDFYHIGCTFHALLPLPLGFWLSSKGKKWETLSSIQILFYW